MKKSILIIFLLIFNFLHSQEIENIMKLDTIYVLFKEGKNQHKVSVKDWSGNGYYFLGSLFCFIKEQKGIVTYNTTSKEMGYKTADERYIKKSFLRKHKKEIIGVAFLKKLRDNRILFTDYPTEKLKIYYIIDVADFKKNKIKLVEVNSPIYILE
jgi:hypothetical protein